MLLLDSEALSALAHGPARRRMTTAVLIGQARAREQPVATSAAILAEVIRGHPRDAAVRNALRKESVRVVPVDARTAARAGELLQAIGAGSEHAVDAFLVATGDLHGLAKVLTVDTDDIGALAGYTTNVAAIDLDRP